MFNTKLLNRISHIVGAALRGHVITAGKTRKQMSPEEWKLEIRKRLEALEILNKSVTALDTLEKVIKAVRKKETAMIDHKKESLMSDEPDSFWSFEQSGWALGGREAFAKVIADLFKLLDYSKLADQIMSNIGFVRTIPGVEDIKLPGIEKQAEAKASLKKRLATFAYTDPTIAGVLEEMVELGFGFMPVCLKKPGPDSGTNTQTVTSPKTPEQQKAFESGVNDKARKDEKDSETNISLKKKNPVDEMGFKNIMQLKPESVEILRNMSKDTHRPKEGGKEQELPSPLFNGFGNQKPIPSGG
jgi:hypothetical protein